MKILLVTSEALPYCKSGGLGDFIFSYSKALKRNNQDVSVILPYYNTIKYKYPETNSEIYDKFFFDMGTHNQGCTVYHHNLHGVDYYFTFFSENKPVGVIRIYDIDYRAKKATAGSWVCEPELPMQIPLYILIICREIMFDLLGMEKDCFDVRKGNKQVQRTHKMMGAEIVAEDELNYYFELHKVVFIEKKKEIINILNVE